MIRRSDMLLPDQFWSLFLDRDGVINHRLVDEYVLTPADFRLLDGVGESLAFLGNVFGKIFVVTNQQGIGKGLMTENDLRQIHQKMNAEISQMGGRIDKIYFCADLKDKNSFFRKPAIGMGLNAKKDFPAIDFKKSIMVGDTISDMLFGKRLKMKTVFISTDIQLIRQNYRIIDYSFESLAVFSTFLKHNLQSKGYSL